MRVLNFELPLYSAVHQPVASLMIESMHILGVPCPAARVREGLAAGGAGVGAVAGMGTHVCREVGGLRAEIGRASCRERV